MVIRSPEFIQSLRGKLTWLRSGPQNRKYLRTPKELYIVASSSIAAPSWPTDSPSHRSRFQLTRNVLQRSVEPAAQSGHSPNQRGRLSARSSRQRDGALCVTSKQQI